MIYGIDFSTSLADVLVKNLFKKYHDNPFELAKIQIILPTRRACQSLKETFFKYAQNKSVLLPQMISLYEMDKLDTDLPPAISEDERLFLLTKLCQAKPNLHEVSKAYQVAIGLAELLDLSYQYQADFSHLEDLVPMENLAQHWQETVQFLDVIRSAWPKILAERGQIDRQDKIQKMILKQAEKITKSSQQFPLIVAGLTADLPAVAHLMRAVLKKGGDIYLDGVDIQYLLTDPAPSITHPQNLILKTLHELDISANKIQMLSTKSEQENLIEQAFRSDSFQKSNLSPTSLKHLKLILADSSEQESLTIALILRNVLNIPNKTAALITPDRTLARRVINQMKRWHINLDDSAGLPFKHTPTGSFLLQILNTLKNQENPCSLLALYKHPLFSNGQEPGHFHLFIKEQEKNARKNNIIDLNYTLSDQAQHFFNLFKINQIRPFKQILLTHLELAEQWAATDSVSGKKRLWSTDLGQQLYKSFNEILSVSDLLGDIETDEYFPLFEILMEKSSAHLSFNFNERIKILGPIEGRFTHTDVCILGGLNEQVFPPVADSGPWLNQSMLEKLGLPLAQSKIITMTHDFMHALGCSEVYLTRSLKVSGTPTIPSRFIERLMALSEVNKIPFPVYQAHMATLTDTPKEKAPIQRPAPCPPVDLRPNKLSATNIELLKRNPYAIYAKYILSLYPLNDFGLIPKASLYGQIIHDVLCEFISHHTLFKEKDSLIQFFNTKIDASPLTKADQLFYKILFKEKIYPFILEKQQELIPLNVHSYTEESGEITYSLPSGPFTLTARADRIDKNLNSECSIIDYKTGVAPSMKKVIQGSSPQLPIEALILEEGGFKSLKAVKVKDLAYWKLGRESKITSLSTTKENIEEIIQQTKKGILELISHYRNPQTPYEVCPISELEPQYNDYKHLARNNEWQHADEEENDND